MKRYQCIKNVYMPSAAHGFTEGSEQVLCFKQGAVYQEYVNDSWVELTDELGTAHIITKELMVHFKELEPVEELPIPQNAYCDIESGEYVAFNQTGGCSAMVWCTMLSIVLTVLALIFFR